MTLSPVKAGDGHDAHAHLMHQLEHLGIAAIGALRNAIGAKAPGVDPPLWSRAAIKPPFVAICAVIVSWAMIGILNSGHYQPGATGFARVECP